MLNSGSDRFVCSLSKAVRESLALLQISKASIEGLASILYYTDSRLGKDNNAIAILPRESNSKNGGPENITYLPFKYYKTFYFFGKKNLYIIISNFQKFKIVIAEIAKGLS